MKRTTSWMVLVAGLGCLASQVQAGKFMSGAFRKSTPKGVSWGVRHVPSVPGMVGPYGEPIPVQMPYALKPPTGADAARAMLATSMPLDLLHQTGLTQTGASCPPGGCAPGGMGGAAAMRPPGMPPMPGGPGMPPGLPGMGGMRGMRGTPPPGAVAAVGARHGGPAPFPVRRTSVRFLKPEGMKISWYAPRGGDKTGFSAEYLQAPARYNFLQASIYRLKISDIPGRNGMVLYPTLEVVPANKRTATFLAHSSVPVTFTNEDFAQIAAGNFVTKVIYLPNPEFQDLASTGPGEVVSSRLEPGVDPIAEAQRRGSILLVIRIGNIDLELEHTPAMDAPNPFEPKPHARMPYPARPRGMPPGMPPAMAGRMVPYGALPPMMGQRGRQPALVPPGQGRPTAPVAAPGGPPAYRWSPNMQMPSMPATTPTAPVTEEKESSKGPLSWLPGWGSRTKKSTRIKQTRSEVGPVGYNPTATK